MTYNFEYLRAGCRKCSHPRMSWDIALIFFVLGVILPWSGRARLKKFMAMPQVGTMERLVLYASTIGFQWLAAAGVAWLAWVQWYPDVPVGQSSPDTPDI